jgi:hypothetical protein
LGHIISTNGIVVDHNKIEVIRGWKIPRNMIEVRSFMGVSSYYQRFIKVLSNIASPIASFEKKRVKF